MSDSAANLGISNRALTGLSLLEPAPVAARRDAWLLLETVSVTTAVILAIRYLAQTALAGTLWFLGPVVLVAAALLPAIVRKDRFPEIGWSKRRVKEILPVLASTCVVVFGATFAGLWLLKLYGFQPPLRVARPPGGQLLSWIFYQFLYVAVAEEVFFRGYLQSNLLRLASTAKCHPFLKNWISIVVCACFFAGAHIIVQGNPASALTFFPGVILGWLFIRTKSLLAPIIFHALANTCYCIMTTALA